MIPALALAMLLSTGPAVNPVTVANAAASKTTAASTSATATVNFNTTRTVTDQDAVTLQNWLMAGYNASDYQIRADLSSGVAPTAGDSTGVWLSMASNRSWSLTQSPAVAGTATSVLTIQIRDAAAPNTVRGTATYTLSANSGDRTAYVEAATYSGDGDTLVGNGVAQIIFSNTGVATWQIGNDTVASGNYNWRTGDTDSAGYEIRATLVSGTTPSSGTQNTWLPLSTVRTWSNSKSGSSGTKTSTLKFEIRNATTLEVLATNNVTITANYFP